MRIHFHVIRLLLAIATIISAAPVFASDGQLEINQACAVNTGCFSGDTLGFPVTITQPGSYRLTGNLEAADENTTAIIISGSGVTLDFNGFALMGPVSCTGRPPVCSATGSGNGVTISSFRNVTVRNGMIRGFGSAGISAASGGGAQTLTIEALRITDCAGNGMTIASEAGAFIGNHISHNGGNGINAAIGNSTSKTFRDNVIFNNAVNGVQTSDGMFIGNTIFNNVGFGVYCAFGNATCSYVHNAFYGNNDFGNQYKSGTNLGGNLCGSNTTCP